MGGEVTYIHHISRGGCEPLMVAPALCLGVLDGARITRHLQFEFQVIYIGSHTALLWCHHGLDLVTSVVPGVSRNLEVVAAVPYCHGVARVV